MQNQSNCEILSNSFENSYKMSENGVIYAFYIVYFCAFPIARKRNENVLVWMKIKCER